MLEVEIRKGPLNPTTQQPQRSLVPCSSTVGNPNFWGPTMATLPDTTYWAGRSHLVWPRLCGCLEQVGRIRFQTKHRWWSLQQCWGPPVFGLRGAFSPIVQLWIAGSQNRNSTGWEPHIYWDWPKASHEACRIFHGSERPENFEWETDAHIDALCNLLYPLVIQGFAIEHGHKNSGLPIKHVDFP